MGGSADVQPFQWFSELCVKAYLASRYVWEIPDEFCWYARLVYGLFWWLYVSWLCPIRPYADQIMQVVSLMLGSGLPCFKGETLKRMRLRFQLDKSERAVADYMIALIRESFENRRTVLYDVFQNRQVRCCFKSYWCGVFQCYSFLLALCIFLGC